MSPDLPARVPSLSWGPTRQKLAIAQVFLRTRWRRWRSRSRLEAWQEARVQAFLDHIRRRSPWTDERFAGRPTTAWRELEPIGKAEMMARFDDLNTAGVRLDDAMAIALRAEEDRDFAPTLGGLTVGLSSGTSGHRGLFLVSPRERALWAGTLFARMLPSILRRERIAFFLRANSALYETLGSRRIQFVFFDLADPPEAHLDRLAALEPTILAAPPSMLRFLVASDAPIRPGLVISIAEVLDPIDEAFVAAGFGVPVHQIYQATEGLLATTCAEGTLHLVEDGVVVEREWLDAERTRFSPILTDFHRATQPIVRYRLNDVLTLRADRCTCGSALTAIEAVEGRCDDVFRFAGAAGEVRIFPDFLRRAVLTAHADIAEYRIRQVREDAVEVGLTCRGDRAAIEVAVRASLDRLWSRVGARSPVVTFVDFASVPTTTKLKRVVYAVEAP